MSDIKFECSNCRQHLACEEQDAGKQIQCPACNQLIQIPEVSAAIVPAAGPSRLRISRHNPEAPRESVTSSTEPLQPEAEQPEPGRVRSWRWVWWLSAVALVAAAAVFVLPGLSRLSILPKPTQMANLSVQTLTVQFAMLDTAGAKPDGAREAADKFAAALRENFGHANMTACSGAQELNQWLEQWPVVGAFKLAYNRDNAEIVIWSRVNDRTTILKTYPVAKADDLTGVLKQAKDGFQVLSK